MIKLNLVPSEILAKAHQKQQMLQVAAAGVAVLGLIGLISAGHFYKLKSLENTLAADNAKLKKLQVIVDKVEELERTAAAVRARLNVIVDLLKGRTLYPHFMSDFVRSVPLGVRVRSVAAAGGGSTAGPLKLTMAAESKTNEDIAGWVKNMETSGLFTNAELGPVTAAGANETKLLSFTMTVVYTPKL